MSVRKLREGISATAIWLLVCATLTVPFLLGGCSNQDERTSPAVAIVLEKTQTSQLAAGVEPCVERLLEDVVRDGGFYSITLCSSKPETIASTSVKPNSNTSEAALDGRWSRDTVFDVARNIDEYYPAYPEVDPLEGLRAGAEQLKSDAAEACDSRTLVYVGTCVPTCGLLDCTGAGKYGDVLDGWDYNKLVSTIVESTSSDVSRAEALPDLTGIHVVFVGFGRLAAGSQCDIPPERIAQLKSLWTKVLSACGATFDPETDFIGYEAAAGESEPNYSDYPTVTPVVWDDSLGASTVSFDSNVLEFRAGKSEYVDYPEGYVDAILAPYAETLQESGQQVVILGTTANDGDQYGCRVLGRQRAERVRDDLVRLGVDASQITIASAGYEGTSVHVGADVVDFYHSNYAADGEWDEGVARTNRAVHLIPLSMSDEVLNRFGI